MTRAAKKPTVLVHLRMETDLYKGLVDECDRNGWRISNLAYTSDYILSGQHYVGALIDGEAPEGITAKLLERGIPIVFGSFNPPHTLRDAPRVLIDKRAAGRLAAESFARRGFKDFGWVGVGQESENFGIFTGFKEKVEESGGTLHVCRITGELGDEDTTAKYERYVKTIAEWLEGVPLPLAMLASNARMGARIIAACEMVGLFVPEQVAILCAVDTELYCNTAPIPLSAIDTNRERQGREMVALLKRLSDGEPAPREPILIPPAGVLERRSTDILAVPDPMVATAVRFMWDHMDWPIKVDDVALEVGTSRATLERAFRIHLGRGVNGELRRKRMERCQELLLGTDMTIEAITKAVGLMNKRYLHRIFKETYGMTPRRYRNENQARNDS